MSNRYTRLEEKCPLLGDYCNQEEKDCDKCINQEKAWQDIQCYIECHDYGISCGFLEKYYKMFYLPGLYVNPIILDIIENNKEACKLLFKD